MDPDAVPSATLALAVAGERDVELWGLGDSPLVVLLRTGELVVSTDEALEALDARVVELMLERSAGRDLTVAERRALVRDEVVANRRLRNTPAVTGAWTRRARGSRTPGASRCRARTWSRSPG